MICTITDRCSTVALSSGVLTELHRCTLVCVIIQKAFAQIKMLSMPIRIERSGANAKVSTHAGCEGGKLIGVHKLFAREWQDGDSFCRKLYDTTRVTIS